MSGDMLRSCEGGLTYRTLMEDRLGIGDGDGDGEEDGTTDLVVAGHGVVLDGGGRRIRVVLVEES